MFLRSFLRKRQREPLAVGVHLTPAAEGSATWCEALQKFPKHPG